MPYVDSTIQGRSRFYMAYVDLHVDRSTGTLVRRYRYIRYCRSTCKLRSSLDSVCHVSAGRAARAPTLAPTLSTAKSQPPNAGCNLAPVPLLYYGRRVVQRVARIYVVSISANRHITMRRAYMHSYLSLLLASSYVATGRVSAFMSAYPGVTRGIVTTPPAGLAMVRNRGLEIPEEGATPLRKCLQLGCHVLHLINSLRKAVHSL